MLDQDSIILNLVNKKRSQKGLRKRGLHIDQQLFHSQMINLKKIQVLPGFFFVLFLSNLNNY